MNDKVIRVSLSIVHRYILQFKNNKTKYKEKDEGEEKITDFTLAVVYLFVALYK